MNQRSPYYSLLHPKPLARRVSSFGFPRDLGDRFQILHKWLRFASDSKPSNLITEAQFLHDIFVDILGYRSPFETSIGAWELELHPKPVLGFFAENFVNVIVEISINTAEQGAIIKPEPEHETTEWLVVLDYREICLYHRNVSSLFCQRFAWESLADLEQLKAFYFLLSRRTLLKGIANSDERSRTTQLLEESHQLESEILKNFYSHYSKIRGQLIKDFRYRLQALSQSAPSEDAMPEAQLPSMDTSQAIEIAIYQAQKLLNRILFVAYCEDRQLLPEHLIKDAYEFVNPYLEQPIWENYKAIFRWVHQGNNRYRIPIEAYPLSIFASDRLLDQALFVGDELCRQIKEITRFDFEQDITRHMLTGLLDESLKELAQYRKDLSYLSKRRSPKLPCKNILQSESVIKTLQNYLSLTSPKTPSPESMVSEINGETNRELATLDYCYEYQKRLLNIKVVHPKCGSGVFLVTALEFLISEHERIHYLITKFAPDASQSAFVSLADSAMYILQHNLFGCDVSAEAVDMTRLVLCLRSLEVSKSLPNVNQNIQLGELANCDFGDEFKLASDRGELVILK
jgi:hypothetical protein